MHVELRLNSRHDTDLQMAELQEQDVDLMACDLKPAGSLVGRYEEAQHVYLHRLPAGNRLQTTLCKQSMSLNLNIE